MSPQRGAATPELEPQMADGLPGVDSRAHGGLQKGKDGSHRASSRSAICARAEDAGWKRPLATGVEIVGPMTEDAVKTRSPCVGVCSRLDSKGLGLRPDALRDRQLTA